MIRKALILMFAVAEIALAAPPPANQVPVEIVSAEFGTFDASDPREVVFEPTMVVPHRQGQRYGWVIEVQTSRRTLSVSEEYLLPNAPSVQASSDPVGESLDIPQQRRNQVSQRQLVPVDGKIYGEWAIGPNEPAGQRQLQVLIEGQAAASFKFEVK